jgi:hypothetical protein
MDKEAAMRRAAKAKAIQPLSNVLCSIISSAA